MSTSRVGRRALLGGALAAVCLGLGATASLGDTIDTGRQAGNSTVTVGTFYDQEQFSDTVQGDYPCFAGVTGTIAGVDTLSVHYNNAPPFFHMEGTETVDYRVDFSDGRYAIGESSNRVDLSANSESGVVKISETYPGEEHATVYAPDGTVIGTVTIRGVFHLTWSDLNHNGQPDPGEINATVDQVRVGCP
jgi:hypothetical protein